MTDEFDLTLADGHRLHVYDTGEPDGGAELAVFWHHGTPNIGAPPTPLFRASGRLGIRWVSVDRPGYGSSTPATDRTIGSVAALVERVADHLEIERVHGTFRGIGQQCHPVSGLQAKRACQPVP